MKSHVFSTEIAREIGIREAILFEHLRHWFEHNRVKGINFRDGTWWTYNSVKAFKDTFFYMTEKQIRSGLLKLERRGLVATGCYNENKYDRTKWYSLTEKGLALAKRCKSISGKMDLPVEENRTAPNGPPIPDINTSINPIDISGDEVGEKRKDAATSSREEEEMQKDFEGFHQLYPGTKRGKQTEFENFKKRHKDYKEVVARLMPALENWLRWRKEQERAGGFVPPYPMLSTWINQRRWEYEYEPVEQPDAAVALGTGVWVKEGKKYYGNRYESYEIPMEAPERPGEQYFYNRELNKWMIG